MKTKEPREITEKYLKSFDIHDLKLLFPARYRKWIIKNKR
jgi:hypothetical protein